MGRGRVSDAAKQKAQRDFALAERLGHQIVPEMERAKTSRSQTGYVVGCSCGWSSTPKKRRVSALSMLYWHVLEVVDAAKESVDDTPEKANTHPGFRVKPSS